MDIATEKIKRPLIAHFLDTSGASSYSEASWARLGKNVTSASTDFGAQTETEQDIISNSAATEVTGYQGTMGVSQQCTKGDPVFMYITKLRRERAILGEAHSWIMNVDMWDTSGSMYIAEIQEVSIQVDSYGGDGGVTPTQDFTINYLGDPIQGTATVVDGKPTFTASST